MKKSSLTIVILDGFCALIWTVKSILEIVENLYGDHKFLFALDVLCAVLWIVAFVIQLIRYRKDKNE